MKLSDISTDMVQIIGYEVEHLDTFSSSFRGSTVIDKEKLTHTLVPTVKPDSPIDVGRSQDSELIWVVKDSLTWSVFSNQIYVPPEIPKENEIFQPVFEPGIKEKILVAVSSRKRLLFFALGACALFVVLSISGIPSQETVTPEQTQTPEARTFTSQTPEEAAIEFARMGQVDGLETNSFDESVEFTAQLISQSGEIVLVEVTATQTTGEMTFATLLLQKSERAWRIRQVFDVGS